MKITLTAQESEQIFYDSLCNGHQIAYYGLQLECDDKEYDKAKKRLIKWKTESPCLEDVWMEILRGGGTLTLVDEESGLEPSVISLQDVHERVQETDVRHLLDAINEDGDGDTADVILQSVFYGKVIFG
jgi:NAD-dependent DNA ligase